MENQINYHAFYIVVNGDMVLVQSNGSNEHQILKSH